MREILKILEQDAQATPEKIATMTGMPVERVREIIKKAEADKTIVKYRTMVNWEKLGDKQVWALIEVKMTPERDVGFDAVAERIYRFPEARSVYLVSGTYDLAVLVVGHDMQEVSRFVSQKLAPMESVNGTVTHFLLKRYKEDGEVLDDETHLHRQAIAP